MPKRGALISKPFSIRNLAMTLAHATAEQQRALLGENLYPLVQDLEPHTAPKVTGMLLELDRTEVLNLIQSPRALKSKVAEAMEVLTTVDHPSLRNGNVGGGMPRRGGAPSSCRQPPVPIRALKAALAHATPDEEATLLGSNLYPLVHKLVPKAAAKVTGMLLELERSEVLHLIQSPKALKSMVAEAMEVLSTFSGC